MTRPHGLCRALVAFALFLAPVVAWPVGGRESMDRPSARALPVPEFLRETRERFDLPPVPAQPEATNADTDPRFWIASIVIDNNTVMPADKLARLTRGYTGRRVSVAELEELRQKLTRAYIDAGFVNSGAVIPDQDLRAGVLHVRIIEGRIEDVRIHGHERLRRGYIRNRLLPQREQPLNVLELQERFQALLNDPLIEGMNGRILPGSQPGRGVLDVEVVRARPYYLALFGDNYRPPSIGAEGFSASGWLRNLTGIGDVVDFTLTTSSGSNRYYGGVSLPLNDSGTSLFFRFDEGDSRVVEEPVQDLNIQSRIHSLEGGFNQALFVSLRHQFSLGALLAVRESETSLLGRPFSFVPGEASGRNQATVWRLFHEYKGRLENHAIALRSTFSMGMNALGATAERDPRFPDSEFFAWLGQTQYAWLLTESGMQLLARATAQFSNNPLLPLEKIAIGGVATVRGYRENYRVTDEGFSFSLELRYPLFDTTALGRAHRLSLVPFFDLGRAWDKGQGAETIYSVGLGFNWELRPLFLDFYYGHALTSRVPDTHDDIQDDGLHFQVRMDLSDLL